ncbi:Ig-like domain-containing protein [Natribacillus halophilus]
MLISRKIKSKQSNTHLGIPRRMAAMGESPSPESIEVQPSSLDMVVGATQDLSVTLHYDDDTSEDVTDSATIESENNSVASADGNTVEANNEGETEITVSYEGQSETVSANVEPDNGDGGGDN